jgi:hypothetical protein
MAVHAESVELQLLATGSDASRQRFQQLRRLLLAADVITGLMSGVLTGAVAGASAPETLVLALVLACAWPLAAFSCGLYAREDLRAWASGISEAPRLMLTCLAVSWPMFGLLTLTDVGRPAAGAFFGALACAAIGGVTRSGARLTAHRTPALRQRTLIVGSGHGGSPTASSTIQSSGSRSRGTSTTSRRARPARPTSPTSAGCRRSRT